MAAGFPIVACVVAGFELEHHDNAVVPLGLNEPGYVLDFDVLLDRVATAGFGAPVGRELTVTVPTDHPMAGVNRGRGLTRAP